jgi:hypothetical protein
MKATAHRANLSSPNYARARVVALAAAVLVSGCSTTPKSGVTGGNIQFATSGPVALGSIGLSAPGPAASVSFQKAEGQIETFGDGATLMGGRILNPSGVTADPGGQAIAGVFGFVAAPFAAVYAGASSASHRLLPNELSQCESNLLHGMQAMAQQERFQEWLVKVAAENGNGRLIRQTPETGASPLDTLLEAHIAELRLERAGQGDASYVLDITGTARLLKGADHSVLRATPIHYRTEPCLFLDWTLANSFQQVTETAYREMAGRLIGTMLANTQDPALLAGAGHKHLIAKKDPNNMLAGRQSSPARLLPVQFVSNPPEDTGSIGVFSTTTIQGITLRTPLTRDQAAQEAVDDMNWSFDGLYNHPNLMVSLPSIAVGIPIGLWKQGVAVVRGLSASDLSKAEARLNAVVRSVQPHQEIATQLAQNLARQTRSEVLLATADIFDRGNPGYVRIGHDVRTRPASLKSGTSAAPPGTIIDLQVTRAVLSGKEGVNPSLALCIEGQARVLRAHDRTELYSCPVHYLSDKHSFKTWADKDAKLFREELQNCYQELGSNLANQLIARALVPQTTSMIAEK